MNVTVPGVSQCHGCHSAMAVTVPWLSQCYECHSVTVVTVSGMSSLVAGVSRCHCFSYDVIYILICTFVKQILEQYCFDVLFNLQSMLFVIFLP